MSLLRGTTPSLLVRVPARKDKRSAPHNRQMPDPFSSDATYDHPKRGYSCVLSKIDQICYTFRLIVDVGADLGFSTRNSGRIKVKPRLKWLVSCRRAGILDRAMTKMPTALLLPARRAGSSAVSSPAGTRCSPREH